MRMRNFAYYVLPIILTVPVITQPSQSNGDQWKAVDAALGRSGQMQPGGVYKFGMARKDLEVTDWSNGGSWIGPRLLGRLSEDGRSGNDDG